MVKIDELLGKHFAVLGTTGTGKSCSVALILRRILEKNPKAHVLLLLDVHREYAASFQGLRRGGQAGEHEPAVLAC